MNLTSAAGTLVTKTEKIEEVLVLVLVLVLLGLVPRYHVVGGVVA